MSENQNEKGVPYDPNCYRCREKAGKPRAGTDRLCAHHKDEAILMLANVNAALRTRVAELEKEHEELVVLLDVDRRDDDSPATVAEAVEELLTEKRLARQHVDELEVRVAELEPLATFARVVLRVWWCDGFPGDLDGDDVQGMAEAAGLWRAVQEGEHSGDCEACGGAGGPCGELTDAGVAAVREEGR